MFVDGRRSGETLLRMVSCECRESLATYFDRDWSHAPDACVRCAGGLYTAADEETHYFEGLCSYCSWHWRSGVMEPPVQAVVTVGRGRAVRVGQGGAY